MTTAFALILMVGRVALGFHYPTDVLGGAAIGALGALAIWAPPIRTRIDGGADWVGGRWNRGIDAAIRLTRRIASARQRA